MSLHGKIQLLGDVEIALLGHSQVGKSTLINQLLEGAKAVVGDGSEAQTKNFIPHKSSDSPLVLWDSRGLEVKDSTSQLEKILNWFMEKDVDISSKPLPIVLLCVSNLEPLQESHKFLFQMVKERAVVIVVITKAYEEKNFVREAVSSSFGDTAVICEINSVPYTFTSKISKSTAVVDAFGVENLVDLMIHHLKTGLEIQSKWRGEYKDYGKRKDDAMKEVLDSAESLAKQTHFQLFDYSRNPEPFQFGTESLLQKCVKHFSTLDLSRLKEVSLRIFALVRKLLRCGTGIGLFEFVLSVGAKVFNVLFELFSRHCEITWDAVLKALEEEGTW